MYQNGTRNTKKYTKFASHNSSRREETKGTGKRNEPPRNTSFVHVWPKFRTNQPIFESFIAESEANLAKTKLTDVRYCPVVVVGVSYLPATLTVISTTRRVGQVDFAGMMFPLRLLSDSLSSGPAFPPAFSTSRPWPGWKAPSCHSAIRRLHGVHVSFTPCCFVLLAANFCCSTPNRVVTDANGQVSFRF